MRVPLSWLRDYVDFDLPPERLAERLTLLGLEVKGIEHIGADWQSVVVGELVEVVPHPNADRLNLTKVRITATDEPRQIVCGAHNIEPGQRVPVALPGAVLPGGKRIGVSTIQGTALSWASPRMPTGS
jgi:phenylalanyl-tRNA synthetase beta chain